MHFTQLPIALCIIESLKKSQILNLKIRWVEHHKPQYVDMCGDTPLHNAAHNGHLQVYQGIMQYSEHNNPGNKLAKMLFVLLLFSNVCKYIVNLDGMKIKILKIKMEGHHSTWLHTTKMEQFMNSLQNWQKKKQKYIALGMLDLQFLYSA